MFSVLEPASVLICASLPMTQSLFKYFPSTKIASYLFSFSNEHRLPVPVGESKPGPWTKLDKSSLSSQTKGEGQVRNMMSDTNEEYELTTAAGEGRKGYGPMETRDLV